MNLSHSISRITGLATLFLALAVPAHAQLGTINFTTTANKNAQPYFLEGVKDLHSFAFDEAAVAFRRAQKADPNFALAYWGEAMSYNHPLWAQQDLIAARAILEGFAPDAAGRLAKAGNEKERAYIDAQQALFYGSDNKLERDIAYSDKLAKLHARWPEDDEISIFYSLALLGTVRPGDVGFSRQALAASLALPIFQRNPNHPGAAHFIIHAFDDPDHAILALPAARAYAKIAPDAPHALHMPAHIFVQLGYWEDVRNSNTAAYASAIGIVKRLHVPEGREDFHTLSWLQYANLMLGHPDEAQKNLDLAHDAAERNPNVEGVQQGYLNMHARQLLETSNWQDLAFQPQGAKPNISWTFIVGYSAAHRKDYAKAKQAIATLQHLEDEAKASPAPYTARPIAIDRKEIEAEVAFQQGNQAEAVALAKSATDIELTLKAPSGPPDPIKPATEYYADLLVATGDKPAAAKWYQQELARTPNRTTTVKALTATGITSPTIVAAAVTATPPTTEVAHVH